jgi:hypothetical protein
MNIEFLCKEKEFLGYLIEAIFLLFITYVQMLSSYIY